MQWDDLRVFLEVSRKPRLEQAARRLNQDPTTISRRLKRLETDLGTKLFERTRRGHVLTPAGEALAARAETMETASLEIAELVESETRPMSGRVRIGVPDGFGTLFFAPFMDDFAITHPQIDIDLVVLSGFLDVPKREADMSVLLARPKSGRLKTRKLTDYTLHLYAHKSYLKTHPPIHTPADLSAHTLIGYVDDLIYSNTLRYYEEMLPGLALRLCSSSIFAQMEMTRSGAGIAILPHFMAHTDPDLVPLLLDQIRVERSYWLAIHEDVYRLPRVQAISAFLQDQVRRRQEALVFKA